MAEELQCLVKSCDKVYYKQFHLCKKHFDALSEDMRESICAMHKVLQLGEISEQRYLLFIRKVCQMLEPEMLVLDSKQLWHQIKSHLGIDK